MFPKNPIARAVANGQPVRVFMTSYYQEQQPRLADLDYPSPQIEISANGAPVAGAFPPFEIRRILTPRLDIAGGLAVTSMPWNDHKTHIQGVRLARDYDQVEQDLAANAAQILDLEEQIALAREEFREQLKTRTIRRPGRARSRTRRALRPISRKPRSLAPLKALGISVAVALMALIESVSIAPGYLNYALGLDGNLSTALEHDPLGTIGAGLFAGLIVTLFFWLAHGAIRNFRRYEQWTTAPCPSSKPSRP